MLLLAFIAIRDTRKQVVRMILLERDRAYSKILNDMAWLYIAPTQLAHTSDIAKGLHEFVRIQQDLTPELTEETLKSTVENESLALANDLVEKNYATWQIGLDLGKVNQKLSTWKSDQNRERIQNLLGKKDRFSLL
jgi:hypothetical protein